MRTTISITSTGVAEPGAIVLIDIAKKNTILFEPQQDRRTSRVYGPNVLALQASDREALGYSSVLRLQQFDLKLSQLLATDDSIAMWLRLRPSDKADEAQDGSGSRPRIPLCSPILC